MNLLIHFLSHLQEVPFIFFSNSTTIFCRYFLPGNILIKSHVLCKGGSLDKWTALGFEGFWTVAKRLYKQFSVDDLDPSKFLSKRGLENPRLLPGFSFRDDGLRLWDCIIRYVSGILELFYTDSNDVIKDTELQAWMQDLNEHGFPAESFTDIAQAHIHANGTCLNQYQTRTNFGLPKQMTCIEEVTDLVSKIIFTCTCTHAASHSEAMDMYGFEPTVPARMCQSVPQEKGKVKKATLVDTLPEQDPELYSCAMAHVMSQKKADEVRSLSKISFVFGKNC